VEVNVIDHLGIAVSEFARSKAFFEKALAPLGYEVLMTWDVYAGFGVKPKPDFWIAKGPLQPNVHVAFRADNRAVVDAFYAAAMSAGATDNGKPGLRPHYHANYYGAFVKDFDGNNIEAVCHEPG
jgi:catechol 2,3-dioxygenase-like lactoylglutathione lyase family enzyme